MRELIQGEDDQSVYEIFFLSTQSGKAESKEHSLEFSIESGVPLLSGGELGREES